jgi:hypothetical protein
MAETKRLTAAEKRALAAEKEAKEMAATWAEFTAKYPSRFANALFKYMELEYAMFRVNKLDDETYEFSREDYSYSTYELKVTPPVNYSWEFMSAMDNVESYLADYAAEKAEELRKMRVRLSALEKLTPEERDLLGV